MTTDITLAATPETGISDIILRISGAPLYTPNVFDRNVALTGLGISESAARSTAAARSADTELALDQASSFLLTYGRSLTEAMTQSDATVRDVSYVRNNSDNCAAIGLAAVRIADHWRSAVVELMDEQLAAGGVLFLRSLGEVVPTTSDSASFSRVLGRTASTQVLSEATAARVFDAVRAHLEDVGLTDSTTGVLVFPRGAVDAVPATVDEATQQTVFQRGAAVQTGVLVVAGRDVTVYYVPRQSTDELGQLLDARSSLDSTGLAGVQAATALESALGGTVGPATPMMGGYALALVDAPTQMEDG